jgi:hypothetical protein
MGKQESDDTEITPVLKVLSMEDVDRDKEFDPYNTATDLFNANKD